MFVISTRRRKSNHIHQSLIDENPNYRSTVAANTNLIQVLPARNSSKRTDVTRPTHANVTKPRWCVIFVRINDLSSSPKNPIHIGINNSLPFVSLHLGIPEDDKNNADARQYWGCYGYG